MVRRVFAELPGSFSEERMSFGRGKEGQTDGKTNMGEKRRESRMHVGSERNSDNRSVNRHDNSKHSNDCFGP